MGNVKAKKYEALLRNFIFLYIMNNLWAYKFFLYIVEEFPHIKYYCI